MGVYATKGAWQRERLRNYFLENVGKVLTYEQLAEAIPTTRKGVSHHIGVLRRKIAGEYAIWNVYGKGYKMVRAGTCPYCGK